jgi:hypothetical protein
LTTTQRSPSTLTAMEDCVFEGIAPDLAAWQFSQPQFHWGRPPPAPVPRRRTRRCNVS